MKVREVKTLRDFIVWGNMFSRALRQLDDRTPTNWACQIEIYLRSLRQLVLKNRHKQLTWSLFASLLYDARFTLPGDVNPAWNHRMKLPSLSKGGDDLEYASNMIAYQISELRYVQNLMASDDPHAKKLLGSYISHEWHNPALWLYLSCATSYFGHTKDKDTIPCSWYALALFLHVGKIYE